MYSSEPAVLPGQLGVAILYSRGMPMPHISEVVPWLNISRNGETGLRHQKVARGGRIGTKSAEPASARTVSGAAGIRTLALRSLRATAYK